MNRQVGAVLKALKVLGEAVAVVSVIGSLWDRSLISEVDNITVTASSQRGLSAG